MRYFYNINAENRLLYKEIKWPLDTCGDGTGPYNETDGKHPSKFELYAHIDGAYQHEKEMEEHLQSCYICDEKVREIVEEVRLEKEAFMKYVSDNIERERKNNRPRYIKGLKEAIDSKPGKFGLFDAEHKEFLKKELEFEESWGDADNNGKE